MFIYIYIYFDMKNFLPESVLMLPKVSIFWQSHKCMVILMLKWHLMSSKIPFIKMTSCVCYCSCACCSSSILYNYFDGSDKIIFRSVYLVSNTSAKLLFSYTR